MEARADRPGSEICGLLILCCWRNADDDWVEVDDGLEMSFPTGGRGSGDGALSSAEAAAVKTGRCWTRCEDGGRKAGSMGEAR